MPRNNADDLEIVEVAVRPEQVHRGTYLGSKAAAALFVATDVPPATQSGGTSVEHHKVAYHDGRCVQKEIEQSIATNILAIVVQKLGPSYLELHAIGDQLRMAPNKLDFVEQPVIAVAQLLGLLLEFHRINPEEPPVSPADPAHRAHGLFLPDPRLDDVNRNLPDQRTEGSKQVHMVMKRELPARHDTLHRQLKPRLVEDAADHVPYVIDAFPDSRFGQKVLKPGELNGSGA